MGNGNYLDRAAEVLGPGYDVRAIDGERCVCKKIGGSWDVEISGIRREGSKNGICRFICLWQIKPCVRTLSYRDGRKLKTFEEVRGIIAEWETRILRGEVVEDA